MVILVRKCFLKCVCFSNSYCKLKFNAHYDQMLISLLSLLFKNDQILRSDGIFFSLNNFERLRLNFLH